MGILCVTSCDQEVLEVESAFAGEKYDERFLGKWERQSYIRDFHNSITIVSDTLIFQERNKGNWDTYHFDRLNKSLNFAFYTNQDSLFVQFKSDSKLLKYQYNFKKDTLYLTSPVLDSLIDSNLEYFTMVFNKTQ